MWNFQKIRERFGVKEGVEIKDIFGDVVGYDDIKQILNLSLLSDKSINIVISGPYGCGKSTILRDIEKAYGKRAVWFDCSSKLITTAGIRNFLFDNPNMKILILDELSRMSATHQEIFLNLMQFGRITDTKAGTGRRDVQFNGLKVYASSNNIENLIGPLRSRMDEYELPPYDYETFRTVGFKKFEDFADKGLVLNAIDAVWYELKSKDVRELEKIMKYAINSKMELDQIIATKLKYKPRSRNRYRVEIE